MKKAWEGSIRSVQADIASINAKTGGGSTNVKQRTQEVLGDMDEAINSIVPGGDVDLVEVARF